MAPARFRSLLPLALAAGLAGAFALPGSALASAEHLAFPPDGYQTTADQIFLIGTASANEPVSVNGRAIDRSARGHFAPVLPLALGPNILQVRWGNRLQLLHVTRLPAEPAAPRGLAFAAGSLQPSSDISRLPGERLTLSAIAPAGARVEAHWHGRTVRLAPRSRPGQLPPNLMGLVEKNRASVPQNGTLYAAELPLAETVGPEPVSYQLSLGARSLTQQAPGRVSVRPASNLPVYRVSASEAVARTGPGVDYARRTPLPRGTSDVVTGSEGAWLRLGYGGWVRASELVAVPDALAPHTIVRSVLTSERSAPEGAWTDLALPLEAAVPFDLSEGDHSVELLLHGAVSQTDILRVQASPLVERVDIAQVSPDSVRYTVRLRHPFVGGYTLRYDDTTLVLSLRHPPAGGLAGRTIVLDPGHGGPDDPGTTGPTGLHEKDLTLETARHVRDELTRRGARVVMSRETDVTLDLVDRQALIQRVKPDCAISLHYNALPDGGDPAHTRGVGAFWYDPIASRLAEQIHRAMTGELNRPSYGVFWDNLALTRPVVAPSVLIEVGFLINPEDFEWITDAGNQAREARAIADGLEAWFQAGQAP